jgi:hypothetical protein
VILSCGTTLERGLLDLEWEDYILDPSHSGEIIEKPHNLEVIKQFLGSIKAPDRAKATYKQKIMEGQGIDELGTCKSLWLMVGRMHVQIQHVSMAKTTLIGLGMRVTQNRDGRREEDREEVRAGSRVERLEGRGDKSQGKMVIPDRDVRCAMCGKTEHASKACHHRRHPEANTANTTWRNSVPGKAWTAKGVMILPTDRTDCTRTGRKSRPRSSTCETRRRWARRESMHALESACDSAERQAGVPFSAQAWISRYVLITR